MMQMKVESPEVTQQTVFELVDRYMIRDLSESEILGLQQLTAKYGPAEIQERVLEIVNEDWDSPISIDKTDEFIRDMLMSII